MSKRQFENVTVLAEANIYFDGKAVSHTVIAADGGRRTLGLVYPGEYHFGTEAPERMDVTAGRFSVRLDGQTQWRSYAAGEHFDIAGNSGFDVRIEGDIAQYVCSYL